MATSTQDFSNILEGNKEVESPNGEYHESLDAGPTHGTYFNNTEGLSIEHRQYLLDRHGTIDLDPIPDMGDADPYNWPQWKVSSPFSLQQNPTKR